MRRIDALIQVGLRLARSARELLSRTASRSDRLSLVAVPGVIPTSGLCALVLLKRSGASPATPTTSKPAGELTITAVWGHRTGSRLSRCGPLCSRSDRRAGQRPPEHRRIKIDQCAGLRRPNARRRASRFGGRRRSIRPTGRHDLPEPHRHPPQQSYPCPRCPGHQSTLPDHSTPLAAVLSGGTDGVISAAAHAGLVLGRRPA
jgi:hypothetical protein